MELSLITDTEIVKKIAELQSLATPLRSKVLKELDDLALYYKQILDLQAELDKRKSR
jgi:hypothetical protein